MITKVAFKSYLKTLIGPLPIKMIIFFPIFISSSVPSNGFYHVFIFYKLSPLTLKTYNPLSNLNENILINHWVKDEKVVGTSSSLFPIVLFLTLYDAKVCTSFLKNLRLE